MDTCKKCSGSGIYVDYAGPVEYTSTEIKGGSVGVQCKYCGGTGYVNKQEKGGNDGTS